MNLNKQLREQKKLFKLDSELNKLQRQRYEAPWVKLPKPIQTGWLKRFRLRDDCTRRSDAHCYSTILKHIGTTAFCRRKDFKYKDNEEIKLKLKIVGVGEWDNLGWPEYWKKKYFMFGTWDIGNRFTSHYIQGYRFFQDFYFEEFIEPYFVTHEQIKIGEIETRIAEIENYFYRENKWPKIDKYVHGSVRHFHDGEKHQYINHDDLRLHIIVGELTEDLEQ